MSCFTRIHMVVDNPAVWKKIELSQFNIDNDSFIKENRKSLTIEDYLKSRELYALVEKTSKKLHGHGIIIADCSMENDTYYVYYLGNITVSGTLYGSFEHNSDLCSEAAISDVHGWLKYGEFTIDLEEEKPLLEKLGIRTDDLKMSLSFDDKADFYDLLDKNEEKYKQQINDILLTLSEETINAYKDGFMLDSDERDDLVNEIFDELPDAIVEDDHRYRTLDELFHALKNGTYKGRYDID